MSLSLRELLPHLDPNELPDPYPQMAKLIGMDNAMALAEYYGGTYLYFRKVDEALRKARDKLIREEFNGYNHKELARRFNLSETWVRAIVEEKENNQISLFPDLDQASTG